MSSAFLLRFKLISPPQALDPTSCFLLSNPLPQCYSASSTSSLSWLLLTPCLHPMPSCSYPYISPSPQPMSFKRLLLWSSPSPPSQAQSDCCLTLSPHLSVLGPMELLSSRPLSDILASKFHEPFAKFLLRFLHKGLRGSPCSEAPLLLP